MQAWVKQNGMGKPQLHQNQSGLADCGDCQEIVNLVSLLEVHV
jgi:hypothetical protein